MRGNIVSDEIITGVCPECKKNSRFTYDYSLVKCGAKVVEGIFSWNPTEMLGNVLKTTVEAFVGEEAKNFECLDCGSTVQQCSVCEAIIKYFNTGNCPNCNARL